MKYQVLFEVTIKGSRRCFSVDDISSLRESTLMGSPKHKGCILTIAGEEDIEIDEDYNLVKERWEEVLQRNRLYNDEVFEIRRAANNPKP